MDVIVDELVAKARSRLDRVQVENLKKEAEAGAIVVDTRSAEQRERDGEIPGAHVIHSNVLLWRLSPSSESRIFDVAEDQKVIVVCDMGLSSSVAAAALHEVGVPQATDLVGGYQAWLTHQGGAHR